MLRQYFPSNFLKKNMFVNKYAPLTKTTTEFMKNQKKQKNKKICKIIIKFMQSMQCLK